MLALQEGMRAALNNVAVAKGVNPAEGYLDEQEHLYSEDNSFKCRLPAVPVAREQEKERLPKSFDELAAHLDQEFGRLAAEVEQMAKEIRGAEIHSEKIQYRLLGGRSS